VTSPHRTIQEPNRRLAGLPERSTKQVGDHALRSRHLTQHVAVFLVEQAVEPDRHDDSLILPSMITLVLDPFRLFRTRRHDWYKYGASRDLVFDDGRERVTGDQPVVDPDLYPVLA